jgi:hypothetical protein
MHAHVGRQSKKRIELGVGEVSAAVREFSFPPLPFDSAHTFTGQIAFGRATQRVEAAIERAESAATTEYGIQAAVLTAKAAAHLPIEAAAEFAPAAKSVTAAEATAAAEPAAT